MPMSEFDIIEQYFKNKSNTSSGVITGIGDDAAILQIPQGHVLAVSTDTMVEGVHFPVTTTPADVGFKSLAVNLSDMAAMAATPLWVTLSLTLPDNNESWLSEYSRGFFELANRYDVALVGGDISRGPLSITVQIMGIIPAGLEIKRSGAAHGDSIYITGQPGMASYALAVLDGREPLLSIPPDDCLLRLNRPEPRVAIGLALRNIASAAIDISDGLAADIGHLLRSSHVGADINLGMIPIHEDIRKMDQEKIWSYCLNGGDDYELCFTVAKENDEKIHAISKQEGCEITRIGIISREEGLRWCTSSGDKANVHPGGYRHF